MNDRPFEEYQASKVLVLFDEEANCSLRKHFLLSRGATILGPTRTHKKILTKPTIENPTID
jgi:hypothetical protein